jgi:cobalamin biosynthesis protein CobT
LVDNSGSMGGRKTKTAMSAAYALSSTLERVKVAHECIGFTTGSGGPGYSSSVISAESHRIGRSFSRTEPVYMPIFKTFEERLTPVVKKRFAEAVGNQNFLANNIDGEAVETAYMRLLKRKERRKVLIVLSDGFPACYGNASELYSHLHKAVADATKSGVQVIGIGIMSNAVKTFYPNHVVLNELEKLPLTVMGELKRILTAA